MSDVIEINDLGLMADFRPSWESLLGETEGADFFRTLDWLEVYWRHYGAGQRLRVLMMLDDGEPVGFVPLAVRSQRTKLGRFRMLGYPLDDWGSFYGPVGRHPDRLLAEGLQYILSAERDWDFLEIGWADTQSPDDNGVIRAMQGAGVWQSRRRLHTEIPVVNLDGDWETYWARRKGSWRSNCRRNEKKAARLGNVEHVRYRPEPAADNDIRWDLFAECQRLAQRSWQGHSESGTTLSHETVCRFLADVHAAATRAGYLDLNVLKIDGRSVAFVYNYAYRGYVSSLRLGFDPEFSRHGVGTVLMGRLLRDSFERGDRVYDFLPGSLSAKRPWQTSLKKSYRYSYCPPGLGRVRLLSMKRWFDDWLLSRGLPTDGTPAETSS